MDVALECCLDELDAMSMGLDACTAHMLLYEPYEPYMAAAVMMRWNNRVVVLCSF